MHVNGREFNWLASAETKRVEPHSTFSVDASCPYIFSNYFLFYFVLNAVFTCIETDEMLVPQSKHEPERHYKMPRLDLNSEVKM